MGLCNTERYAGILRSAKRVYEIAKEIPDGYDIEHIKEHALKVWTLVFGGTSNSAHWFMGSSATNEILEEDSPWAVAVMDHFSNERQKDDFFNRVSDQERFDPFDWSLNISGLLSHHGKEYSKIYDLYAWTEQLIYYLRRYKDEFLDGYRDLSDWASTTLGLCFARFHQYNVYAEAYAYNQICEKIYRNPVVEEIALKQCWHHNLSGRFKDYSLEEIMAFHMRLFVKEPALKTIFDVALEMMGRSYHYDHQYNELVRYLKEEHKYTNTGSFKKILLANKKKKEEYDKKSSGEYRENRQRQSFEAVHGYDWKYRMEQKEEEKKTTNKTSQKTPKKKNVRNTK